jgi:hypothetical protein
MSDFDCESWVYDVINEEEKGGGAGSDSDKTETRRSSILVYPADRFDRPGSSGQSEAKRMVEGSGNLRVGAGTGGHPGWGVGWRACHGAEGITTV